MSEETVTEINNEEQIVEEEITPKESVEIDKLNENLRLNGEEITKQLKNISNRLKNLSNDKEQDKDNKLYYNTMLKKIVNSENEIASTKEIFEKGLEFVNSPEYDKRFSPDFVQFMEQAIEADNQGEDITEFINDHVYKEVDIRSLKF